MTEEKLQAALKKFEELVREQSERSDRIKAEKDYIDHVRALQKEEKKSARIRRWREKCPDTIFNIWHHIKLKLGIARKG